MFERELKRLCEEHKLPDSAREELSRLFQRAQRADSNATIPDLISGQFTLPPGSTLMPSQGGGLASTSGHPPIPSGAVQPPAGARSDVRRISRYEDHGVIGSGGMGTVHRVFDPLLNRSLALKVIHEHISGSLRELARFVEEAQISAQLRHPSIVPVYELGHLDDGRLYFTMEEVRGETLSKAIREVHRASAGGPWRPSVSGWTFRKLIEAFRRLCEGVAYAHSRGVIHRDLKPSNVMLGQFGEVRVLDWGLATLRTTANWTDSLGDFDPVIIERGQGESYTLDGRVAGTPAYMAPEQAAGDLAAIGATTDIYCLGAILYTILCGRAPYSGGDGGSVVNAVLAGPPPPPDRDSVFQSHAALAHRAWGDDQPELREDPYVPSVLRDICTKAMSRAPEDRPRDALVLAAQVGDWLEGLRRQDQAEQFLREADGLMPELHQLFARSARLRDEAERLLADVNPEDPVEQKLPAWERVEEAESLELAARAREAKLQRVLQAAITYAPDHPEAHRRLARLYRQRHVEAEARRDRNAAAQWEVLLRSHHTGEHEAYLRGDGAVTLFTDPPGAEALLYRYELFQRRLRPRFVQALGQTPIIDAPLPMGSYLIVLRAPGRAEVRYPVRIRRGERWTGVPPGESEPMPIPLPLAGSLGPEDCYIPAGWFTCGGDPLAEGSLPERQVWIDGLVMRRFPVTNAEFIQFLNTLLDEGDEEAALRYEPRFEGHSVHVRGPDGRFKIREGQRRYPMTAEMPANMVDWQAARAYASYEQRRTGQPWTLPGDLEWEKAARGVDGRRLPWGDTMDATFYNMRDSRPSHPFPTPVDSFPVDESPYGVRGLAGNIMDWCRDPYRTGGPPLERGRVTDRWEAQIRAQAEPTAARVVRGGHWYGVAHIGLAAHRYRLEPSFTGYLIGMRLSRRF